MAWEKLTGHTDPIRQMDKLISCVQSSSMLGYNYYMCLYIYYHSIMAAHANITACACKYYSVSIRTFYHYIMWQPMQISMSVSALMHLI